MRRRWIGALALASYVCGSLGLAAPGALPVCDNGRTLACACPDAAIRDGTCCCSGKIVARPCCARSATDSKPRAQSGDTCCSQESSNDSGELRFNSCSCGHGGPDQYLLCGDPRLSADLVQFRWLPASSAISAAPDAQGERFAHRPPTPPPRSLVG